MVGETDTNVHVSIKENKEVKDPSKEGKIECPKLKQSFKSCSNPPLKNITHPLRYYEFTRDEIKALEECDKESFYQRCIPFSTVFATATYAAVKYGFLRKNPILGAFPKVALAFIFGHFYGRYSYLPKCQEKLIFRLPADSYLGNVMRQHLCEAVRKEKYCSKDK